MDQRALTRSLNILAKRDDALKEALAIYGKPTPRQRPEGFETIRQHCGRTTNFDPRRQRDHGKSKKAPAALHTKDAFKGQ